MGIKTKRYTTIALTATFAASALWSLRPVAEVEFEIDPAPRLRCYRLSHGQFSCAVILDGFAEPKNTFRPLSPAEPYNFLPDTVHNYKNWAASSWANRPDPTGNFFSLI
jgi:hypothetical protein